MQEALDAPAKDALQAPQVDRCSFNTWPWLIAQRAQQRRVPEAQTELARLRSRLSFQIHNFILIRCDRPR